MCQTFLLVIKLELTDFGKMQSRQFSVDDSCKSDHQQGEVRGWYKQRKEGNVLFNDALNRFYLRLYGVRHMVKDHSDSERGNLLPPHGLLFLFSSKGSFICIIPQTG